MTYFEAKVKFENELNDAAKTAEGNYIIVAENYTDAEKRITEEMTPYCGDGTLKLDIKKVRYAEILLDKDGIPEYNWYKVKVEATVMDGETEKVQTITYLVQAPGMTRAMNAVKALFESIDMEIVLVQKTPIIECYQPEVK